MDSLGATKSLQGVYTESPLTAVHLLQVSTQPSMGPAFRLYLLPDEVLEFLKGYHHACELNDSWRFLIFG